MRDELEMWLFRQVSRMPEPGGRRDVLADARQMFYGGATQLSWQEMAERLADIYPETYAGHTGATVAALLRGEGVRGTTVRQDGLSVAGCRPADIDKATERR